MPLTQLTVTPGIDKENTATGAEGRWIDCDKVRFRFGQPQKIGGWELTTADYYVGVGRAIFNWFDLDGFRYTGLGTNKKVYIYRSGNILDITPIRSTASLTTTFTTLTGSANVEVKASTHGALEGDFVTISDVTTSIGGIANTALNAEFEIINLSNSNSYTIETTGNTASSNVVDTGSCTATYQLNTGPALQTYGYGWGSGTYNLNR